MKKNNVIIILVIAILIVILGVLSYGYYIKINNVVKNPIATIEIEGYGKIIVELYPGMAPNTVNNFIALANSGFYDGVIFHRTIPEYMIQAGLKKDDTEYSPKLSNLQSNVDQDSDYNIKGEFLANGYSINTLRHEEGVISMARADYTQYSSNLSEESYNSGSGQFFIMTNNNSNLNGYYAAFGKVIEGMEIVHKIENLEVETREKEEGKTQDKPLAPPVITKITVDTFGVNYPLPQVLEPFDINNYFMQLYNMQ